MIQEKEIRGIRATKERLEAGFALLEMIRLRRELEGDPGLATGMESAIVRRELLDLEEDLVLEPPSFSPAY